MKKKITVSYKIPKESLNTDQLDYVKEYEAFYNAMVNNDMNGLRGMNVTNENLNRMKTRHGDSLPECDYSSEYETLTVSLRK